MIGTYRGRLPVLAQSHVVVELVLLLSMHSLLAIVYCVLGWPFLLDTNHVPDCLAQYLHLTPSTNHICQRRKMNEIFRQESNVQNKLLVRKFLP